MSNIKDFEAHHKCYKLTTTALRSYARECCLNVDRVNKEAEEEHKRENQWKITVEFVQQEQKREEQRRAYNDSVRSSGGIVYEEDVEQSNLIDHDYIHECIDIKDYNRDFAFKCCLTLERKRKAEAAEEKHKVNVDTLRERRETTNLEKNLFKEQLNNRMAHIRLMALKEREREETYGVLV